MNNSKRYDELERQLYDALNDAACNRETPEFDKAMARAEAIDLQIKTEFPSVMAYAESIKAHRGF